MAFGLTFSPLTCSQLVATLQSLPVPTGRGALILCTANLDHVVHLQRNAALQAAYRDAWCVTADGMPVFAYARLKGEIVPSRVTGADVVRELLGKLDPSLHRPFFLASCVETGNGLLAMLTRAGFRQEALSVVVPPFGFEHDEVRSADLARQIRSHGATHVFFGVGAPKSELWTHRHRNSLGDCYVLNAGAGLDYACNVRRRAPVWMQTMGFEWLWRFGSEPKRLFKRYFIDSWGFFAAVAADLQLL